MKKLLFILAVVSSAFYFGACGTSVDQSAAENNEKENSESELIEFPDDGIAALLPSIDAAGKIENNTENEFKAQISDMSFDNYKDYVDACIEKGFNENAARLDEIFMAETKEGVSVVLSYEKDNRTMNLMLTKEEN